jgi:tetratricopeptide (TPR) repeat protein
VDIKYSKKKEEMRKDPVMEFIIRAKEFLEKQGTIAMGAAVAAILVLGGFMIYNSVQKSSVQKAQEAFGKALIAYEAASSNGPGGAESLDKAVESFKAVVDNNKSSPPAVYSAYMLGHIFLRQQRYDEAITWFNAALSNNSHTGFVGASSLEGLASCYEAKGNLQESLNYLKKAVADDRLKYRGPELSWKAALISKDLHGYADAKGFCRKIIADTVSAAAAYKQKAENLLVEIGVVDKS